jgi:hypothetical protein
MQEDQWESWEGDHKPGSACRLLCKTRLLESVLATRKSGRSAAASLLDTSTSDTTKKARATEGTIVCNGGCGAVISGASVLRCSRCKLVRYCGQRCQRAHWKTHKLTCKAVDAKKDRAKQSQKTGGANVKGCVSSSKIKGEECHDHAESACVLCFEEMIDPILAFQCDNQLGMHCLALIHSPPSYPHTLSSLIHPPLSHAPSLTHSPSLTPFQPISIAAAVCRYRHTTRDTRRLRTRTYRTHHPHPPTHSPTYTHTHSHTHPPTPTHLHPHPPTPTQSTMMP